MSNNWEKHFNDDPPNGDSNKTISKLFEGFGATKTPVNCLIAATNKQHTIFFSQVLLINYTLSFVISPNLEGLEWIQR